MRGQVNQAFIFIFMLIIIGSITLVSFMLFAKGGKAACDAEIATFKVNMQKFADSYSDYGTINIKKVKAPCGYEKLYVLSTRKDKLENADSYPFVIKEYLELSGPERDNNLFLEKDDEIIPLGNFSSLDTVTTTPVFDGPIVFDREGPVFEIKFLGKGKTTEVEVP